MPLFLLLKYPKKINLTRNFLCINQLITINKDIGRFMKRKLYFSHILFFLFSRILPILPFFAQAAPSFEKTILQSIDNNQLDVLQWFVEKDSLDVNWVGYKGRSLLERAGASPGYRKPQELGGRYALYYVLQQGHLTLFPTLEEALMVCK